MRYLLLVAALSLVIPALTPIPALAAAQKPVPAAEQAPAKAAGVPKSAGQCVFLDSLHDWRALDRNSMIIFVPNRKTAYKLEFIGPCPDIRFADKIAFIARDNRLCDYRTDKVFVNRRLCPIGRMVRYDPQTGKEIPKD